MISVCMATYNGERFIKEQLDSILCQLSSEDELIISDDGSTDRTTTIVNEYKDNRIKLLHHAPLDLGKNDYLGSFKKATANFENALKYAKGEKIFLADQDDKWNRCKVTDMLEKLTDFELVMSNFSVIDQNNEVIVNTFFKKNPLSRNRYLNILKSKFIGCCMAFNRCILDRALPFPPMLLAHDYWIGCLANSICFINRPLHLYRRHDGNVSPTAIKSNHSLILKIRYRVNFFLQIKRRLSRGISHV